jgi:hypothetical protein
MISGVLSSARQESHQSIPVQCPVGQRLGTVGFTDDHPPTARQVMPAANHLDATAPVRVVVLSRHLKKLRVALVDFPFVELPANHEFHDGPSFLPVHVITRQLLTATASCSA